MQIFGRQRNQVYCNWQKTLNVYLKTLNEGADFSLRFQPCPHHACVHTIINTPIDFCGC